MSTRIARELLLQLDKKIHTAWDNVAEDPDVAWLESLFKQMLELSGQIAQELPEAYEQHNPVRDDSDSHAYPTGQSDPTPFDDRVDPDVMSDVAPNKMDSIHICNDASTRIPVKEGIGFSYEDRNLDSMYAAEALVEFIGQHAPGKFVHVRTGDYVHAPCDHPECESYDAAYWHYLVPKAVWDACKDSVLRHDRVWREANETCKRTGRIRHADDDSGYSADCSACLRGQPHTDAQHEAYLQRNEEASIGDWESLDPPTAPRSD